jgi:hypothetical protein
VKVLLRVILTLLLVFVGVKVGLMFAPRLARLGTGRRTLPGSLSATEGGNAQPDWGGGQLSFHDRSVASIVDSVRTVSGADSSTIRTYASPAGGVLLRQTSDSDYAVALAMPSRRSAGRTALFELPSSGRFRKELLPGDGDAEPPAADVPLYPQSRCRMQVGRGTACFIGFYLTPDSVEAVRSFYVRTLGKLGWQRVAPGRPGFLETFTKRNQDRSVVVQLRKQDSMTTRIGLVATASGSIDPSERK